MVRRELVFATYLAPSVRPVYQAVVDAVSQDLRVPARLVTGRLADELAAPGAPDFAFVCGLPYARLRQVSDPPIEAIAAPVVRGARYHGRPIYFSDVIVRADSPAGALADLRGASWAWNEPDSHSGYLVTLHRLLQLGATGDFFGRTVMTGFHQESIRRVAAGDVDASAIDSQVLEVAVRDDPELGEQLRVIDTLGPSTIQPLVASRALPRDLVEQVAAVVTGMHDDGASRAALDAGLVDRFVAIDDSAYDDIRAMLAAVEAAGLQFRPGDVD